MGKDGEKESTERKLPFYSFLLLVPPRKPGLMGLGRKMMSLELWLCICPLPWSCRGRMAGTHQGPLAMQGQGKEEVQEVTGGDGARASLFPGSHTAVSARCLPMCQHLQLPGHWQRLSSPGSQRALEAQTSASISARATFELPGPEERQGRVKKQLLSCLEKRGMRTLPVRLA